MNWFKGFYRKIKKAIINLVFLIKKREYQRFYLFFFIKPIDLFLKKIIKVKKESTLIKKPKKILLSNLAHIGDVINSTVVLKVLKDEFPNSIIGFIIGSHCKDVIKDHPLIDYIYTFDHWMLNRSNKSFLSKIKLHITSFCRTYTEINLIGYDTFLDLYLYPGKAITLTYLSKIPVRIGFDNGYFGALYTHPISYNKKECHITDCYKEIFEVLKIKTNFLNSLELNLPPISNEIQKSIYFRYKILKNKYIILHPGVGVLYKSWPNSSWLDLISRMTDFDFKIVITGKGDNEFALAQLMMIYNKNIINLVDQLNWNEYVALLSGAKLIVSVDSQAGHLAAAFDIPAVLLFTGINHLKQWAPLSSKITILQNKLDCIPCNKNGGCQSMACIKDISAQSVYKSIKKLFNELNSSKIN